MKKIAFITLLYALLLPSAQAEPANAVQHAVKKTSAHQSLPYTVDRATEGFTKTKHGGIMRIVAKSADDTQQINAMQQYLQQTATEYSQGDFSSTERFHGTEIPGLAQMKAAQAGAIRYNYQALPDGGQIVFSTEDLQLIKVLHEWLDFQINAHGHAASPGHE